MTHSGRRPHPLRKFALFLGAVAIFVGGVDVARRASSLHLDERASFLAFAPAAALEDPAVAARLAGHEGMISATSTTAASPIVPARLKVPSLGIDASVEQVGKKADGTMGTPSAFGDVAWYAPGSKPGASGNAVFAGHVNNALTKAGVFSHLSQVKQGARIEVWSKDGQSLAFEVVSIEQYPADTAPADAVFTTEGTPQVILITCDGDWDSAAHSFDKRLVVVGRLLQ